MITVLCPTYNEQENIENILEFFCRSQPADKELYIIDGGSTDETINLIKRWQNENSSVKLLHNPQKYVSFALNLGIKESKGNPIVRLDAHTTYEWDYFQKILETFHKTDADIVGGPMRAIGFTPFQKAVAFSTSTIFGIGDSKIHKENYEGYSDHVYLGAWKRDLFKNIGFFDERLIRNQDDEFHYRAKSLGRKIYLNPEIRSYYFPRKSFRKLFSQYFQYGEYKPLVLLKIKGEVKIRHLIPSAFVLYLLILPLLLSISLFALVPIVIYLGLDLFYSLLNKNLIPVRFLCLFIFPTLHIAYGTGSLWGLYKLQNKHKTNYVTKDDNKI